MAESFSPYSSISQDGSVQLDSTKRCLFPAENESPMARLRSAKIRSESCDFPSIEKDLRVEETKSSPISVVSVLCGTDTTISTIVEKSLPPSSCETVFEEQNKIEVQYHQSGHSDLDSNHMRRTSSGLRDLRTKPLLDSEKTPSKAQTTTTTTKTTPLLGCGGRSCVALCDDRSQLLERTIAGFLDNSSASTTPDVFKTACTDWQNWYYFGFGGGKENSIEDVKENVSKENIRSNLRHRTSKSLRARKSNIRQLKNNIAPFAPSPSRSPARAPDLFKNRSFSVSDHRSAIVRVSEDKKSDKRSFPDVLELCTMYESIQLDSPDFVRAHAPKKIDEDELSYGSDPEDFTRRRLHTGAHGPTNASDSFHSQYLNQSQTSIASPSRSFNDVNNDQLFSIIVQELFNKTTTLVLHPILDQNQPEAAQSSHPLAVDAWVERGQHLPYAMVQPKWIWKTKGQMGGQQSSTRQKFCVQGIELLDITKILKMEETDECVSFAKASHCFIVKSIYHEEFCFEAKSRSERNRIVDSLKLLIARFGAQVLTGDSQVYYEFFWTGDGAPGEAPDLHQCFGQEGGRGRKEYCEA